MTKALYYIQSSLFFPPHKPFLLPHHHQQCPLLTWHTNEQQHPSRRCLSISASSTRSRKVKSNAELSNDIIEFVVSIGFPEGYVPSLKEFSENGRNDLANIVRRRGYKLIKELLANSTEISNKESKPEQCIDVKHYMISNLEDNSTGQSDVATDVIRDVSWPSNVLENNHSKSLDTDLVLEHSCDPIESLSSNLNVHPVYSSDSDNYSSDSEISLDITLHNLEGRGSNDVVEDINASNTTRISYNSSEELSLDEKVACFIQTGDLGTVEDFFLHSEESESFMDYDNVEGSQSNTLGESEQAVGIGNGIVTMANAPRDNITSEERKLDADFEDLHFEARNTENELEINRLKYMLHQKELDMTRLKKEIEKQQRAVSALQDKAEAEINKAKKLLSEKDAELLAVEESLSGLEEIEIQYCGEGETVEVTGSFNGWQNFVKLNPQPSISVNEPPTRSRKSEVWSTVLRLYPGNYEIKFVVDGQWKIDPRMDSISRGHICNNVLRVGA